MSLTIINNTEQKPNMALGMVRSCLAHYKHFKRPVKQIVLSHRMWDMFIDGLKRLEPEKVDDLNMTNIVWFKDAKIKKGSIFQVKSLTVELKERVLE